MRSRRLLGVLAALVLLTGCGGLPLPNGVRDADGAVGGTADDGGIVVVAPGPQRGTTATQLVEDYLYALSRSPQDGHAVAKRFLAPGVECCGGGGETVLYPVGGTITTVTPDPSLVRVTFDSVGRISADGAYRLEDDSVEDAFRVVPVDGELRLSAVPDGLRLVQDDLERSFTPYPVHYLGRAGDGSASGRLVQDRVFLPATAEPAQALVDALLRGPTDRLSGAVSSAAPPGTTAAVRTGGGVATVDLSEQVRELDARARQRLAAQLVWTLVPAYSGVRLLVEGQAFAVDGAGAVQDRRDWTAYDPVGLDADAPLLYLDGRRLRRHDAALPEDSPVTTGELPVDAAAQSPSSGELAVRTRGASGVDEVRTGPLGGPFGEPVLRRRGLSDLSWGPGDAGVWVLEPGPQGPVWRVPGPEAVDRTPERVLYAAPPGAGPLTSLRVSRDGARIALVFGGRLHVGRIEPVGPPQAARVRIADVELVSRELVGVTDVAWESGTSLVALGGLEREEQVFPASVAVDGSSFEVVQRPLVGAAAVEVAAAPRLPLVVAADVDDERVLYEDDGTLFRAQQPGRSPFYPG